MRIPLTITALLVLASGQAAMAQTGAKKPADTAKPAPAATSFKEHKLNAITAWLAANKTSPDRVDALPEAARLALELSKFAEAKAFAASYGKEFEKGEQAGSMKLVIGHACAGMPGGDKDARKAFQEAIDAAGENPNAAVGATMEYADTLVELSDPQAAVKALEALADKFSKIPQIKAMTDGRIADIGLIGKEPIAIEVKGLDEKPISLAALKGKVVLIDFWATWCGPCVQELPNVIETYKKLHSRGFEIVGISLDKDRKALDDFLASHDMPWPQFYDGKFWKNEVGVAYGVQSIPKTYLLDQDGKVHRIGLRGPALGKEIEKLLSAKAPAAVPAKSEKK